MEDRQNTSVMIGTHPHCPQSGAELEGWDEYDEAELYEDDWDDPEDVPEDPEDCPDPEADDNGSVQSTGLLTPVQQFTNRNSSGPAPGYARITAPSGTALPFASNAVPRRPFGMTCHCPAGSMSSSLIKYACSPCTSQTTAQNSGSMNVTARPAGPS